MEFLWEHYTLELSNLNKDLATLWEKGNSLAQDPLFETSDKALTSHMESFNKDFI